MRILILLAVILCLSVVTGGTTITKKKTHSKHAKQVQKTTKNHTKSRIAEIGTRVETVNQIADVAIREIRPIMEKFHMNPFKADDQEQRFTVAKIKLTDIQVYNLTTIKRAEDVIVLDNTDDKVASIHIKLTFDDVQIYANYRASALLFSSSGRVRAKLTGIYVDLIVLVDFENVNVTLDEFKLKGNRDMDVKLYGNIESYIINIVSDPIATIFSDIIFSIAQGPIKDNINKVLDQINEMLHTTLSQFGA